MGDYICMFCRELFTSGNGKVPCPKCGRTRKCSGHRKLLKGELKILMAKLKDS